MRVTIKELMNDGKDINEILDMPYEFLIEVLREKEKKIKHITDEDEAERILDRM